MSFHVPEEFRILSGQLKSLPRDGNNGAFRLLVEEKTPGGITIPRSIFCIASNGGGWEHVSVSIPNSDETPSWNLMCKVKWIFWDEEDCVVQYHPPASQHVNNHDRCLHLWRPTTQNIPMPPKEFV